MKTVTELAPLAIAIGLLCLATWYVLTPPAFLSTYRGYELGRDGPPI